MTENYEKIIAVLTKESLRDAFDACATEMDAVNLLAENGVETTESEFREVLIQVMKRVKGTGIEGELSEKQLEQIAGGYSVGDFFRDLWKAIGSFGMGTGSNY